MPLSNSHVRFYRASHAVVRKITNMITWGITALTHDASLSVIKDDEILFAAHAERYSKVKNDPNLNDQIIRAAREYGSPDLIVWFEDRWLKKWRQFKQFQWQHLFNLNRWPSRYLKQFGINQEIVSVKHHLSHAASGFYTSPFEEAAIVCIDSLGEENAITIWKGNDTSIDLVHEINYPTSLGLLYSAFTQRCDLKPNEEEYILMGMAAYGQPRYFGQIIKDFIDEKHLFKMKRNCIKGIGDYLPNASKVDLAASVQVVAENVICDILTHAQGLSRNLVYMGGVALNCVANRHLHNYFDRVWIMPNPGDSGSSLGAAAYATKTRLKWKNSYLGTNISGAYPVDELLSELLKGNVVGVANGRAEFGPRALGNRSLFADPRRDVRDGVNAIKQREKFRPFAPMILEEHVHNYFDLEELRLRSSPYMQYTVRCRYPKRFPAICHVDNSSRVQTVNREQHPGCHELLTRFYEKTGCPMLLNTSLNIKGMPIVNDREDATMFKEKYGVEVL